MDIDALICRILDGEEAAFADLVLIYQQKIYNIAFRFFNNAHDAQDITQETLIKIYRALDRFQRGRSFDSWVYMIAINNCRDLAKKRKRQPAAALSLDDQDKVYLDAVIADGGPGPEKQMLDQEAEVLLKRFISELPGIYREVIVLREIAGLRYEEISEALHLSLGTVKSRINRGRFMMREKILAEREHSFFEHRYVEREEGA